ncbi:unnamed protein product [Gongylonema pulchrum]|uniref:BTB domain-containing protein n=1 Tax=Gongylonema pulchrum TaxID=637853 RepID=A0A183E437_9BILA|nr:unnamed protein product [Gongylonema pulchrum]
MGDEYEPLGPTLAAPPPPPLLGSSPAPPEVNDGDAKSATENIGVVEEKGGKSGAAECPGSGNSKKHALWAVEEELHFSYEIFCLHRLVISCLSIPVINFLLSSFVLSKNSARKKNWQFGTSDYSSTLPSSIMHDLCAVFHRYWNDRFLEFTSVDKVFWERKLSDVGLRQNLVTSAIATIIHTDTSLYTISALHDDAFKLYYGNETYKSRVMWTEEQATPFEGLFAI